MARMVINGGAEFAMKLSRLKAGSDEIARKALYAGAGIVADQIKKNLKANLAGSDNSSGDLLDSLGITPIKRNREGDWNVKIGFDGYDRKGVPNQLKARVMESGSSKQKKKPFVRPAVTASSERAVNEMGRIINEETQKIMGGK